MRVLMTADTVGGVWTFSTQLASELLARGCHVALVSVGGAPSVSQTGCLDILRARWPHTFRFADSSAPLEWMQNNAGAYEDAAPLLLRIAEESGAELLLSSQYCFGALPFDGPKIVVAHSDVLSWAKACLADGLEPSAWLRRYRALVGEGLESADAVVAPTHWMLHALEENFRIPGELHVIYNGRSITHMPASKGRRVQAVTAGRLWDEGKNLGLFSSIELTLPLLIAGDIGHKSSPYSPGNRNVVFVGQLCDDEILSLFLQSSIYVCASKYEPFGMAPLEAALCGCAVVAHDIPSLREVWGDAALFFDDGSSLSALLTYLSQNDRALASARKQARWRASQFSASRMAGAYLELFRSMCSRKVREDAA